MSRLRQNKKAFTIIELLVSAAIIITITLLVVFNLKGINQKSTLEFEAEKLSSLLRRAHINTLIGLTDAGIRPPGGYGVQITQCAAGSCSYILFADKCADPCVLDYQYDGGPPVGVDVLIQQLEILGDNVFVSLVQPVGPLNIVFAPPSGQVYINGATTPVSATTTLRFTGSGYVKELIVDQHTGRINIQ